MGHANFVRSLVTLTVLSTFTTGCFLESEKSNQSEADLLQPSPFAVEVKEIRKKGIFRPSSGKLLLPATNEIDQVQLRSEISVCVQYGNLPAEKKIFNFHFVGEGNADPAPQKLRTDHHGCVNLSHLLNYNRYAGQKDFQQKVYVSKFGDDSKSAYTTFNINPWLDSALIQDPIRHLPIEESQTQASLSLDEISINFTGFGSNEYEIDRYLQLTQHRKYQLSLSPKIIQYNPNTGNFNTIPFTNGKLRVEIFVASPFILFDEAEENQIKLETKYISSAEETLTLNGQSTAPLNIDLPIRGDDLPALRSRSQIYLRLSPIDEASSLKPIIVKFPFEGFYKTSLNSPSIVKKETPQSGLQKFDQSVFGQSERPEPYQALLGSIHDNVVAAGDDEGIYNQLKSQAQKLNAKRTDVKFLKEDRLFKINSLEYDSFSDPNHPLNLFNKNLDAILISSLHMDRIVEISQSPDGPEILSEELESLSETENPETHDFSKFCFHFFSNPELQAQYEACLKNPLKYLDVFPVKHIDEITSPIQQRREDSLVFQMGIKNYHDSIDISAKIKGKMDLTSHYKQFGSHFGAYGKVGIKSPTPILDAGAGIETRTGLDWGTRWMEDHYERTESNHLENQGGQDIAQAMIQVDVQWATFSFDASVRRCVLIRRSAEISLALGLQASPQPIHICSSHSALEKNLNESWYFLKQELAGHGNEFVFQDRTGSLQSWTKVIRGKANYNRFQSIMTEKHTYLILYDYQSEVTREDYIQKMRERFQDNVFYLENMEAPGTIQTAHLNPSNSVSSHKAETPPDESSRGGFVKFLLDCLVW